MHFLKHESSKSPTPTSSWTPPYLSPKNPSDLPLPLSKLISYSFPHLLPRLTLDFCSFPDFFLTQPYLPFIFKEREEGIGQLQSTSTYLIRKYCKTFHNIKSGSIAPFCLKTCITLAKAHRWLTCFQFCTRKNFHS